MDTHEARTLARTLMDYHGLSDWRLTWTSARTQCGICRYRKREIGLSAHYVTRNPPDLVRNTILHEIAHALVGPGHGHGRLWQLKAIEIGCAPTARNGRAEMPEGRYRISCPHCGQSGTKHRMAAKWKRAYAHGAVRCGKCGIGRMAMTEGGGCEKEKATA